MPSGKAIIPPLVAIGLLLGGPAAPAAALQSPDQVKLCLRLMMQVTNDFDRQITRKTYARIPHENMEFHDATAALLKAVANEPADFRTKVGSAVQAAIDSAQKEADDSAGGDDAMLRAQQGRLVQAVNAVFSYFPQDLRPDPNVQPGRPAPR